MAENKDMNTHPAWEDWVGFGLGVLIVLTPYFSMDASFSIDAKSTPVQLATTIVGLMVLFMAFIERLQISEGAEEPAREWEEVFEALLGALLIALPFIFGYANGGTLRYWHFGLGAIVFLLAIVELRRDYVGDMQRHGWWRRTQ